MIRRKAEKSSDTFAWNMYASTIPQILTNLEVHIVEKASIPDKASGMKIQTE